MAGNSNIGFWNHFRHAVNPNPIQALELNIMIWASCESLFKVQLDQLFSKIWLNADYIHPIQVGIPK